MTQATTVSCANIVVMECNLLADHLFGISKRKWQGAERVRLQLMEDRKWGVVLFVLMMVFMINLIVGVL